MNVCICCQQSLLRHISQGDVYWYCSHCRQAMPGVEIDIARHIFREQTKASLQKLEPCSSLVRATNLHFDSWP